MRMGSANMWWKRSICLTKAPRYSWLIRFVPILPPRPRLLALAQTFASQGLPASITLDRDTRWVGAPQGSDFPAAKVALLSVPRGHGAPLRSASPTTKWLCRKISSHAHSGVPCAVSSQDVGCGPSGDGSFCDPLQLAATAGSALPVAIDRLGSPFPPCLLCPPFLTWSIPMPLLAT